MDSHAEASGQHRFARLLWPPAVAFDGPRTQLAGLLIRNLLLTIATLGIFRFWGKTRVRHFLWRHVRLWGEPLEYLGTGTELLVGFLVVIVVFAPLTSAYSYLPYLIPQGIPFSGIALQLFYYAVIGFLIQVAVYRARRYRLTRTAWRGVRFGLDGSAFVHAAIWLLYGLLTVATLGLAYPWLRLATTRYFANHARFGSTACSIDARPGWLFRRWLWVIAPILAAILLFVAVNGENFEALASLWSALREGKVIARPGRLGLFVVRKFDFWPMWLVLPGLILLIWYRVSEFRYFVSALRIGETRLESRMVTEIVYGVHLVFYVVVAVAGMFFILTVVGLGVLFKQMGVTDSQLMFLIYSLAALSGYWLYGFFRMLFVRITLLTNLCDTLRLERAEALEWTVQSTAALPGHGEGLADALDVGGL